MRSAALLKLAEEVIGAAEARPDDAPGIYQTAARQFREYARREPAMGAALSTYANEFEAHAYKLGLLSQRRDLARQRVTVDDFVEQERAHAIAHAEVGHLDDFEIKARQNQIEAERNYRPRISIAPESILDGTRIGNQLKIKYAPTPADIAQDITAQGTVVFWQGVKVEAQAFSIDVGVNARPALDANVSCRPFGLATYGSDGFQTSFMFDIGLGVRFTGVGNYCSVLVGMQPPRDSKFPPYSGDSGVMELGASLGFFAAPSQAPVFFTSHVDDLAAAGTTDTIPRPSKAQFILPPQMLQPGGGCLLVFVDYSGAGRYSLTFGAGGVVSPIPLSTEIAGVKITNTGALADNYTIPWMLST